MIIEQFPSTYQGIAQAGGPSSLTLDKFASVSPDAYKGLELYIASGAGAGQERNVLSSEDTIPFPSLFAPLTSSIVLDDGTGSATFNRASTSTQTDFEDNTHQALAGEARFQGARRVANLLLATELFSDAAWSKINGGTGSVPVVSSGFPDPAGGATAWRIQANRGAGNTGSDFSLVRQNTVTGINVTGQMWLKSNTGTPQQVQLGNATPINITTAWEPYSYTVASSSGAFDIGTQGTVVTSNSIDVLVWHPQAEDVTGQSDQSPAEYESVGVLPAPYHGAGADGVQYFTYLNGNTVDANGVVTEAQGAAIPAATLLGYLPEPASTNYFLNSGAPVTQTITLAAGTYVTWMTGTGSITTSAGTATASGYGVASSGTPNTIVVTVGGTVVFTVGGTVTTGTVESNALNKPTSYNPTTSAAVTRAGDVLTYPSAGNILGTIGSIYLEGITASSGADIPTAIGNTVTDRGFIYQVLGFQHFYDGTNDILGSAVPAVGALGKYGVSYGGVNANLVNNGGSVTTGTFDGDLNLDSTFAIGLNGAYTTRSWNGTIKNVRIWGVQLPNATLQAITQ